MYEEAFDERTSVIERQKLLQRFAIWALLNKEVSAAFVAEVLEEPEDDIQDFISTYSSWFNSPESGKYQLYHERLKVFLLQKLSEKEIHELHAKLISRIEQAIEEQKADEFEWYGLEFLGMHLYVYEANSANLNKLTFICENLNFIERQINLSEHYEWPKMNLQYLAILGANKNIEYTVKSAIGLLKINIKERSDVDSIFVFLEKANFEFAFNRIESLIKNNTKENKFVFYLQFLEELLSQKWVTNDHLVKTIDFLILQIDKIYFQNIDSLVVKLFSLLERLWNSGINIIPLLNVFNFSEENQINLDSLFFSKMNKHAVFKTVQLDFAFDFFPDKYKLEYLSFYSKSLDEFEKILRKYSDKIHSSIEIETLIKDFKSLKFVDEKRIINFENFGLSKILYKKIIEDEKIDRILNLIVFINEKDFTTLDEKDFSINTYLFLVEWYLSYEDFENANFYLNLSYAYLNYDINDFDGISSNYENLAKISKFADDLDRNDIIENISKKVCFDFELLKNENEEIYFEEIIPLLMSKSIFNEEIKNWFNSSIFKNKNEFFINRVVPYWPKEELIKRKDEFHSLTSRLICFSTINLDEHEMLKKLMRIDISSFEFFRFNPFVHFAIENDFTKLFIELIGKLESIDVYGTYYYLSYFEIRNKKNLSNYHFVHEWLKRLKNQIMFEDSTFSKFGLLLRRLELELTLNVCINETIEELKKSKIDLQDKHDFNELCKWIIELIHKHCFNNKSNRKLVGFYFSLRQFKIRFWRKQIDKYFTYLKWFLSFLKLKINLKLKIKPNQIANSSYLWDWDKLYDLKNKEKHNLSYWINNYSISLKNHLAKSMHSIDDETIILLRTYYGLNALQKENKLRHEDFKFLHLEWAFELKELIYK
jgi:hypothetical protein